MSAGTSLLNQTLSFQTFERLRQVFQQMATRLGANAMLLTEDLLGKSLQKRLPDAEWFSVLVSEDFSALIHGKTVPMGVQNLAGGSHGNDIELSTTNELVACRVSLTFEPGAIATFLKQLERLLKAKPTLVKTLAAGRSHLQPNDSRLQSEFTLQAIAALDTRCAPITESDCVQFCSNIQDQRDDLEQQVLSRTQELQDAMQVAQTANRAKSQFLAAVSHELRTPLTAIIGISATLLRWSFGELSQRQRGFLQTIHDSGQHLLELINNILDLSQLEDGRTILRFTQFSLSRLAQQTLKDLQPIADLKSIGLELDLRVDARFDPFVADAQRIRQILVNLLGNAIKFTPESGTVMLRVYADAQSAIFQVKDTGIGIAEGQRLLLFQKFQQLDTSYRRMYEGVGLGLAITKQLVDLHGGRVSVESTVGVGTVFTVQLPNRRGEGDRTSLVPETADQSLGRILLIEKHEESANIICDLLTAAGYQLVWMLEEVLDTHQIEVLQPIVVIADCQSADSHGDQLIRRIRQNPLTKSIKVIGLINHCTLEAGQRCLSAGADEYLTKPLQPDQILPKVFLLTARTINP